MNDLSADIGLLKRQVRDVQSVAGNIQHQVRKLDQPRTMERPGGLVARFAARSVISRATRQSIDGVAKQHFAADRDLQHLIELRTISGPATTSTTAWAGDLVATVVADIAENLLPASAFSQLRALGLQYMFVDGGVARVPFHNPVASGAFVGESNVIPVGALLLSSFTLKPKKVGSILTASRELMQGAAANVETTLQTLLGEDLSLMVDNVLLGSAAATTAAPAGLLNGLTTLTPTTGSGLTALMGDVKKLIAAISPAIRPVLIMNSEQSAAFALLAPNAARPIIAPYLAANTIVALDAASFASSLGVPEFQTDEDAAIHEETVPLPIIGGIVQPPVIGSIAAPTRSLWQTASLGIRTLIDCDWTLRRAGAVAFITGTTW